MSDTLVTGGSGMVGTQIKRGIKMSSKDCDLRDWNQTIEYFEKIKPKNVLHCAAKVGGVAGNMAAKGTFFYENTLINSHTLEASRLVGVEKLVSFLSTCVFPDPVEYPLTEQKVHLGPPHKSNYGYAYSKRMLDVQTECYRDQYGVNYICVIPTNIYGTHDNFNLETGHVIPSLIHRCYLAKENNEDFVVWGSGTPLREFIFADDVAELLEWSLDNYDESEPIILSNAEEISIKDTVEIIVEKMNFKGNLVWDKDKPDGQFRKQSDNSKLLSYLPDVKFTPIEVGIEKTVNWFVENYEGARK
tara:strand:- start:346 stop:1251 length:906 start_codon:yes stop_codon:yes gene_type:complete